jgi:two-component system, response regulator
MIPLPYILIVEDNEDDFEATERSFRKAHFLNPISWCRSGQEALTFLHCQGEDSSRANPKADLILLDLNMPGMDGRRLLEIIKTEDDLKSISVVVLTTSNNDRDIDRCYALGASTYIQKPVSFEALVRAIQTMKDYWFGIALLPSTHEKEKLQ